MNMVINCSLSSYLYTHKSVHVLTLIRKPSAIEGNEYRDTQLVNMQTIRYSSLNGTSISHTYLPYPQHSGSSLIPRARESRNVSSKTIFSGHEHEFPVDYTQKTSTKSKSVFKKMKEEAEGWESAHEASLLSKELLETDGCWRWEGQFSSRMWALGTSHVPIDGPISMHIEAAL